MNERIPSNEKGWFDSMIHDGKKAMMDSINKDTKSNVIASQSAVKAVYNKIKSEFNNGMNNQTFEQWSRQTFISRDEKGKNRKLDYKGISAYILEKLHAMVSPSEKYMYIYNPSLGIYSIDYRGAAIEAMLHKMLGNDMTEGDIRMIIRKSFHDLDYTKYNIDSVFNNGRYICMKNGLYDIEAQKRIPHTPDIPFINQIPWNYNPLARCPNIDAMMPRIFTDEQIRDEYEWMGYVLTPGNRYKLASIYYGNTDSGRSTYFNLMVELVDEKNVTSLEPQLMGREFYLQALHGKILNVCGDVGVTKIENSNRFKQITGGDLITANVKNKAMIEFVNPSKSMWATNDPPTMDDDTSSIYNRVRMVQCDKTIDKNNNDGFTLESIRTSEEMSGFINHAIEGLHRLEERGKFILPTIEERTLLYDAITNSIFDWAEECLEFTSAKIDRISGDKLYESFTEWRADKGIKVVTERKPFTTMFKKAHFKNYIAYKKGRCPDGNVMCAHGVRFAVED